jgi:hypothetical protein
MTQAVTDLYKKRGEVVSERVSGALLTGVAYR